MRHRADAEFARHDAACSGAASDVNSTMTRCRRTLTERCRGKEELDNGRQLRPSSGKDVPTRQ